MTWTEERIAELKRLWTAGHTTAHIGKVLGISKSAVIGKTHRLNLPSRPSPIRRSTGHTKPRPALFPKRIPKIQRQSAFTAARSGNGAPECFWPIGDPRDADFHFCGEETAPARPYCPEHCARAYVSRTRDETKAA